MSIRYCDWVNGFDYSVKTDRTTAIIAWSSATTYALNDIVHNNVATPNRKAYKSLQNTNLNHALSDGAWWVCICDGTATLPYQSITDANAGLTGNDEVRVAKSVADTNLTGTITLTYGSTTVTGSGTSFTTELVIGDAILGNDSNYYEVVTITNNTSAVLYGKFLGSTQSGLTLTKLGYTDTGSASGSTTVIQSITANGTDANNKLAISGGWNLSGTPARDGKTIFKQTHATFATRNGRALSIVTKNYLDISYLGFYRYAIGIITSGTSNSFSYCNCFSNGATGLTTSNTSATNSITYCNFINNSSVNLSLTSASSLNVANCKTGGSLASAGMQVSTSCTDATITSNTSNYNSTYGINQSSNSAVGCTFTSNTCNYNSTGIAVNAMNTTTTSNTCNYNTSYGIVLGASFWLSTTDTCSYNATYNLYMQYSQYHIINSITCNSTSASSSAGILLQYSNYNVFNSATCNSNNNYGVFMQNACNNVFNSLIANSNGTYGIYSSNSMFNTFNNYTYTGTAYSITNTVIHELPQILFQNYGGTKGVHKAVFSYGVSDSNTDTARSGKCLKITPTDATVYCVTSFYFKGTDATAVTLSAYIRKTSTFNGSITGEVFFNGVSIVASADKTPTANDTYEQKTFSVTSGMITDDSVIELRFKTRGTAGSIYIDDLGIA